MAKILYEKYNVETFEYLNEANFFEEGEQLEGYTSITKGNLIKAFLDLENGVAYEGATEEEVQEITLQKQTYNEFLAYEKRCEDGRKAYNQINAEFRVLKENGVIEQNYYDVISETLLPVRNEVLAGQWISSLQKLEIIGNIIIGVDLYNRLHLQITNYISENY